MRNATNTTSLSQGCYLISHRGEVGVGGRRWALELPARHCYHLQAVGGSNLGDEGGWEEGRGSRSCRMLRKGDTNQV